MKKPKLTPNFTVDDIHKIREYNYESTKNLSDEEKINLANKKAHEILETVFSPLSEKIKIA